MRANSPGLNYVASAALVAASIAYSAEPLRLIMLDPEHFHAAQLHVTMLPGFSDEARIYAPLGSELTAHINRVSTYNTRPVDPTHWKLNVYAGPDFLDRMRAEPAGNVVVLSGRNDRKIDYIEASVQAGQNVLADKPWIIYSKDLPRLQAVLNLADSKHLVAYDAMTQRFDIAYQLQQALVNDSEILGRPGSVTMESTHYLYKGSNRPVWFMNLEQQGEGMADVGTHQVDLIEWTLFPGQAIDYRRDVRMIDAKRWPLMLSKAEFEKVTGASEWPAFTKPNLRNDQFAYFANNEVSFEIKGVPAHCSVKWSLEATNGLRDTMLAVYTGSNARVQVRQNKEERFLPEIDVIPVETSRRVEVLAALNTRLNKLSSKYPGLSVVDRGEGFRVVIPSSLRIPDEQYFALLTARFLEYMRHPGTMPVWEKPNMIAKYYITTSAVEMARKQESGR
jgi:hypothetical protein